LEESENDTVVRLCLAGYRAAIRIATALELQTARLAFISSLQRFTHLGSGKPMRRKHIDAIATLLALGSTPAEGNHLKQNWVEVLHTISEVERMQLIATNTMRGRESGGGAVHDHALLVSGAPVTSVAGVAVNPAASIHTSGSSLAGAGWGSGAGIMGTSSSGGSGVGGGPSTDTLNSLQVQLLDPALIDRVFACSAQLDGEAIVDFVQALRSVSEAELANTAAPRVFSLQKMVEVTRANMGRVRIVWSRIWALLAAFFQKAGTHPHIHVSMYAIDSLRQLAMKFLELDELVSFQFQRQFMRPFEVIMASNPNGEIRELILQCIERMIAAKAANIKSGWKGVFLVLQVAANSEANNTALAASSTAPVPTSTGGRNGMGGVSASSLVVQAFSILSNIMDNYFDLLSAPDAAGAEGVEECVNCLVTFGCQTKQQDISAKAIHYLTNCASTLTANTSSTASANVSPAMTTATLSMTDGQHPSALQVDGNTPTLAQRKLSQQQHQSSVPSTPRHNSSVSGIAPQTALKTWFLVLTGLSRMVSDPRTEVRSLALKTLFEILHAHGHVFTQQTWRTVFHGVLFPIFDDVRYANEAHRGPGSASAAVLVSPEPPAAAAGTPAR
jgi:brefeldin A-inhibited guanine nucleotide-exchange protein